MATNEDRIMSERRPQGPPPTPRNPALERERQYAALASISEMGSDDPSENPFIKRQEQAA